MPEAASDRETKSRLRNQQRQKKLISLRRSLVVQIIIYRFDESRRLEQELFTQHGLRDGKQDQRRLLVETVERRGSYFTSLLRICDALSAELSIPATANHLPAGD